MIPEHIHVAIAEILAGSVVVYALILMALLKLRLDQSEFHSTHPTLTNMVSLGVFEGCKAIFGEYNLRPASYDIHTVNLLLMSTFQLFPKSTSS